MPRHSKTRNSDIAAAHVIFQGRVRAVGPVPERTQELLTTQAFPMSAPPSIRSADDFAGLKTFYADGWFCFCAFANHGELDEHGRPVPSAQVLLLQRELVVQGAQDLLAHARLLSRLDLRRADHDDIVDAMKRLWGGSRPSRKWRIQPTKQFVKKALIKSLCHLIRHRQLILYTPASSSSLAYLRPLFQATPISVLEKTSWCDYVFSAADRHEDVIVQVGTVAQPPRHTWKSRALRFFSGDERLTSHAAVDVSNGNMRDAPPSSKGDRLLRVLAREYIDVATGSGAELEQRAELLAVLLDQEASDGPIDPYAATPSHLRDKAGKSYIAHLVRQARSQR